MHGTFYAPYIGGESGYWESTVTDLWVVVGCLCWVGCQVVHSLWDVGASFYVGLSLVCWSCFMFRRRFGVGFGLLYCGC